MLAHCIFYLSKIRYSTPVTTTEVGTVEYVQVQHMVSNVNHAPRVFSSHPEELPLLNSHLFNYQLLSKLLCNCKGRENISGIQFAFNYNGTILVTP